MSKLMLAKQAMVVITLLVDEIGGGAGDNSNARANSSNIAKIYKEKDHNVEVKEFNVNSLDAFKSELVENQDKQYIVLGAGDQSAEFIKRVKEDHSIVNKPVTISLSHHASDSVLASKADIIGIPTHVDLPKNNLARSLNIVEIIGASTSLTEEAINKSYEELEAEISSDKPILSVLFGGDAKTTNNQDIALTVENSKLLGKVVGKDSKEAGACIRLVDGPRAGKHLGRKDGEINPVIQAFMDGVKEENPETDIKYFPFIQDAEKRNSSPSAYKALFQGGIAKWYYTMESISTGLELASFKHTVGKCIALKSSSTLPDHEKFAEYLNNKGLISIIDPNDTDKNKILAPETSAEEPIAVDHNARVLAEAIEEKLKNKALSR